MLALPEEHAPQVIVAARGLDSMGAVGHAGLVDLGREAGGGGGGGVTPQSDCSELLQSDCSEL